MGKNENFCLKIFASKVNPKHPETIEFQIKGFFETPYSARCTNNFYRREKSIAFDDVTMSYGFETKFQHSVTTTFFFQRFSVNALSL